MKTTKYMDEEVFTVQYWRDEFNRLTRGMKSPIVVLAEMDTYYDTKQGVYEYGNVKRGTASLEKTRRAALILQQYGQKSKPSKKHLRKIQL